MPRHFWISASIAMLVAAFALLGFALPRLYLLDVPRASASSGEWSSQMQVATYTVPPVRADAIRNTLNTVLMNNREGQPLGQASLPLPDQLMVSAPGRMHDSIRRSIASLSEGEASAPAGPASATLEVWLVDAVPGMGADDPQLSAVKPELDQARQRFGHGRYRLLERSMALATLNGETVSLGGMRSQVRIRAVARDAGTVEASINVTLAGAAGNQFASELLLPEAQWLLVGLLPGSGEDRPERLLLMRQRSAGSSAAAGQ
jgi:hypothetical protein